ncbi:MAG: hypothetical protein JST84_22760 [Acidobacteria bacterium]|nr:hypothetical protein [Acidobacteriota bacterium]
MKIAKVIFLTVTATLLVIFLLGLIGLILKTLKVLFVVALVVALLALVVMLVRRVSKPTSKSGYGMRELESWDKMFTDYKQGTDFKTK